MKALKEGYKETEIGVIPVEWEIVKLEDISNITMGQSPKSDTYNTDKIGIPLIQGNADCKNRKTIPRTYTTELTKECFIGDIIMTVRAPVGAISKSLHNACIGRGVCSIKSKEDNEYIYHCLVNYEDRWDKLSQGSTFTAVSGSDIKNLKFPLPPLKEQQKIAQILSTSDNKIDAITSQIEKAETLKKGLLQKLLSEGLGHSEFKDSELGKIPVGWEVERIGNICACIVPGRNKPVNFNGNIPWITTPDLDNKYISKTKINLYITEDEANKIGSKIVPINSIIMSCVGNLGILAITQKEIIINQQLHAFLPSELVNMEFLHYALLTQQKYMNKIATKTAVPYMNKDNCNSIPIQFPPLKEQKQIAKILSISDEKIEILRAKKQKYETLKKGLLQKLLSGEVGV